MPERQYGQLKSEAVKEALKKDLLNGVYSGGPMPEMGELAKEYGVSRITLRNVLLSLQDEGLITIKRGSGTFATVKDSQRALMPDQSGRKPEKPTLPLPHAQSLYRYVDYLANPHISTRAKNRLVRQVDVKLQLAKRDKS